MVATLVKIKKLLARSLFEQRVKVTNKVQPRDSSCLSGYLKMWQLTSPDIHGYDVIDAHE